MLHEVWSWEGVQAESFIFFNEDIHDLNEEKVLQLVERTNHLLKGR